LNFRANICFTVFVILGAKIEKFSEFLALKSHILRENLKSRFFLKLILWTEN